MLMHINNTKKILAAVISVLMIAMLCVIDYENVAAADLKLVLGLESEYNRESSILEVNVVIKDNPGIAALVLQLYYDNSRVTLISAGAGDIMKDAIVNDELSDGIGFACARASDTTDTGTILRAKFRCDKEAAQDAVLVSVQKTDAANFDEKSVDVTVSGGNAVILTEKDTAIKSDDKQEETLPISIEEPSVEHVTPYMIITGDGDSLPQNIIVDENPITGTIGAKSENEKESTTIGVKTDERSKSDTIEKSISDTVDNQLNPVSHSNHKGVIIIISLVVVIIVVGVILYLNKSKFKRRRKKNEE